MVFNRVDIKPVHVLVRFLVLCKSFLWGARNTYTLYTLPKFSHSSRRLCPRRLGPDRKDCFTAWELCGTFLHQLSFIDPTAVNNGPIVGSMRGHSFSLRYTVGRWTAVRYCLAAFSEPQLDLVVLDEGFETRTKGDSSV